MTVRISTRSFASRFESGSSIRSTSGSMHNARANATRCCWPPERRSGIRSAYSSICMSFMNFSDWVFILSLGNFLFFRPNSTFFLTV